MEGTVETFRASENGIDICKVGCRELGIALESPRYQGSKRIPGPNGDDFS